jgi:hypothetical protein
MHRFQTSNGHQTKLENNDTGILQEADVNARGVQLRTNWSSFFELCNEAGIAWWRTMAADLRFDYDLSAPLERFSRKQCQLPAGSAK